MLCRVSVAVAAVDLAQAVLQWFIFSYFSFSFQFPLLVTLPGFLFQFSFQYLAFSSTLRLFLVIFLSFCLNILCFSVGVSLSPLAATMYQ